MKIIFVTKLPKCQHSHCKSDAEYDAPTRSGPWGYFCKSHYEQNCRKDFGLRLKLSSKENESQRVEGIKMIIDDWGDASVICTLCDNQQSIEIDGVSIYCTNCGCFLIIDPIC